MTIHIASPSHQQNPTPNLLIKLQLGPIGTDVATRKSRNDYNKPKRTPNKSEVGKKAQRPTGNPSPAPTHPHRTHDTTDQWREIVLVASPIFEKMSCFAVHPASNVQFTGKVHEGAFCHTSKLILTILESMESPWIQHVNKT